MMALSIRLSRVALVSPGVSVHAFRLSTRSRRRVRLPGLTKSASITCLRHSDAPGEKNLSLRSSCASVPLDSVFGSQPAAIRGCSKVGYRHLLTRAVDGLDGGLESSSTSVISDDLLLGQELAELSAESGSLEVVTSKEEIVELSSKSLISVGESFNEEPELISKDSAISEETSFRTSSVELLSDKLVSGGKLIEEEVEKSSVESVREEFVESSADSSLTEKTLIKQEFEDLSTESVASSESFSKRQFAVSDSIPERTGVAPNNVRDFPPGALDGSGRSGDVAVPMYALQRGAVFKGTVIGIQPFGAFVSFGAFADGLVHVSKLTSGYVRDVRDVVQLGQEVTVTVLNFDRATGRIALSMLQENEDREFKYPFASSRRGDARDRGERSRFQSDQGMGSVIGDRGVGGGSPIFQGDRTQGPGYEPLSRGRAFEADSFSSPNYSGSRFLPGQNIDPLMEGRNIQTSQNYGGSHFQQGQDRNSSVGGRNIGVESQTNDDYGGSRFQRGQERSSLLGGRNFGVESNMRQGVEKSRFQQAKDFPEGRSVGDEFPQDSNSRFQERNPFAAGRNARLEPETNQGVSGSRFQQERPPSQGGRAFGADFDTSQGYVGSRFQPGQDRKFPLGESVDGVGMNSSHEGERFRFNPSQDRDSSAGGRFSRAGANFNQDGDRFRFNQGQDREPFVGGSVGRVGANTNVETDRFRLNQGQDREPSVGGSVGRGGPNQSVETERFRFNQGQDREPSIGGRLGGANTLSEVDRFRFSKGREGDPYLAGSVSGAGPNSSDEGEKSGYKQEDKFPFTAGRNSRIGANSTPEGDRFRLNPSLGGNSSGAGATSSQEGSRFRFQQGPGNSPLIEGRNARVEAWNGDSSRFQQDQNLHIGERNLGANSEPKQEFSGSRYQQGQDKNPLIGRRTFGVDNFTQENNLQDKAPSNGGRIFNVERRDGDRPRFDFSRNPPNRASTDTDLRQDNYGSRFTEGQNPKPSFGGRVTGAEDKNTTLEVDTFLSQQGQDRIPFGGGRTGIDRWEGDASRSRQSRSPVSGVRTLGAETIQDRVSRFQPDQDTKPSVGDRVLGNQEKTSQEMDRFMFQPRQDSSPPNRGKMSGLESRESDIGGRMIRSDEKTTQEGEQFRFQQNLDRKPLDLETAGGVRNQEGNVSRFPTSKSPVLGGGVFGDDDGNQGFLGSRLGPDNRPSPRGTTIGGAAKTNLGNIGSRFQQEQGRRPLLGRRREGVATQETDLSLLQQELNSATMGQTIGQESQKNQAADWVRAQQEEDVNSWIRGRMTPSEVRMNLSEVRPGLGVVQKTKSKLIQIPKSDEVEETTELDEKARARMRWYECDCEEC